MVEKEQGINKTLRKKKDAEQGQKEETGGFWEGEKRSSTERTVINRREKGKREE